MEEAVFRHPEKWRETCDPFSLPYKNFRPTEILGYPHAGNDVFHSKGVFEGREITAYIKVARRKDAALKNERDIMAQLPFTNVPKVIDYGFGDIQFTVTEELPGRRLSVIVGENEDMESLEYMEKYGEALANLHRITEISAEPAAERRFFHSPTEEELQNANVLFLKDFFQNKPKSQTTVFCHGDFHYANVLWQNKEISAMLDFELAGFGNRDFDIAWAVALRPGQKFFKTEEEFSLFIKGYQKHGNCNIAAVRYYMAQIYVHYLQFSKNDEEYCRYVLCWLKNNCT